MHPVLRDISPPFQFEVLKDTINHFLTILDSKKQKPAIIIQHQTLRSALYKVVFSIQQVSSHFFSLFSHVLLIESNDSTLPLFG